MYDHKLPIKPEKMKDNTVVAGVAIGSTILGLIIGVLICFLVLKRRGVNLFSYQKQINDNWRLSLNLTKKLLRKKMLCWYAFLSWSAVAWTSSPIKNRSTTTDACPSTWERNCCAKKCCVDLLSCLEAPWRKSVLLSKTDKRQLTPVSIKTRQKIGAQKWLLIFLIKPGLNIIFWSSPDTISGYKENYHSLSFYGT